MKAINLKTEYLKNPIGIDLDHPRLMWNCEGGITQTAFQIHAYNADNKQIFDSGKIASGSMNFTYPLALSSRDRVYWQVKLWDETGTEGPFSPKAFFEMGLKNKTDFQAKWITGNYTVNRKKRYPVDCFKKEFKTEGAVKSARLYATACGIYAAYINGQKVSMPLAPGITDYQKRVQYQTYDVTHFLNQSPKETNVINIDLADGWYRGSCGAWGLKNQYGTETKLLAQLELTYENGQKSTIITDKTWLWSNDGAVTFADNKDGEIVDANKTPSYLGKAKETHHKVTPTASNNVPIAEKETFQGEMTTTSHGKRIISFGQNLAGYISFRIAAKKGQKITLRFGEMLDKDGELTLKNIQCSNKRITTPLQKIEYTCKDGINEYKPNFAIFGFQYMEIDTDIAVSADDFTAIAVYSDLTETGFFESSNKLLNKFVTATKWSTKSNSTDLPTDCPTRERHGWTGDAQIFLNSASYLFDYITFAEKFERDLCDEQKRNGCFRQIAPKGGVDFYMNAMDGSPGWSDAGVLIPYRLYKKYNDASVLEQFYPNMKKYTEYKIGTLGKLYPTALPTGIGLKYAKSISNFGQSYGEWAEPTDVKTFAVSDFISPHPEETTAYLVYLLDCMAEIAGVLGKENDQKRYQHYADKARAGYSKLVETKKYSMDTDRQAKLVRPLAFHLLNKEQTEFAEKRLIKALEHYGFRLGTGFLSTPLILDVLASIHPDYAYQLLENEEMPGWLFMTKMGATTIWESWEGTQAQSGIASLNHYSKGAVCEWLFSSMCGIQVDGENHFVIKPLPGGHFTFAKASYSSIFGEVKSGWKKEKDKYTYQITIPANCTAKIILPNGETYTVTAGEYHY